MKTMLTSLAETRIPGLCCRMNLQFTMLLALALVGCATSGGGDSSPNSSRPYLEKSTLFPA